MRSLFLTGPAKTGKSTLLLSALIPYRASLGGFYVQRHIQNGHCMAYALCRAAEGDFQTDVPWKGEAPHSFLTWREHERVMDLSVFDGFATSALQSGPGKKLVLLDEIGGIELQSNVFFKALCALLQSGTPCIGVIKSEEAHQRMQHDVEGADACRKKRRKLIELVTNDATIQILDISTDDIGRRLLEFIEDIYTEDAKR